MKAYLETISLAAKKILLTIILARNIHITTSHRNMGINIVIRVIAIRIITTSKIPMIIQRSHHTPKRLTLEILEM